MPAVLRPARVDGAALAALPDMDGDAGGSARHAAARPATWATPACAAPGRSGRRRGPGLRAACLSAVAAAVLAGCAVGPKGPPGGDSAQRPQRDGPPASPPPDLAATPDAEPRIEPVRRGGPNKPYVVLGQSYTPQTGDPVVHERGLASWYGAKFHGRRTASGEVYNMYAMTAAHRTLPIPSYARVRNPANGREIIVRINDRGPFHRERIIDLSYTAALKLGVLRGVAPVELERLTFEQIRTGAWRRRGDPAAEPGAEARAVAAGDVAAPPGAPAGALATAAVAVAPAARPEPTAQARPIRARDGLDGATLAAAPAGALTEPLARPLPPAVVSAGEPVEAAVDAAVQAPGRAPGAGLAQGPDGPAVADAPAPADGQRAAVRAAVPDDPPDRGRAYTRAAEGWWLQLGAFRRLDGAEALRQKVAGDLAALAPLLAVFNEAQLYRLQAGPYASRSEARVAAARLRDTLDLAPVIVERR